MCKAKIIDCPTEDEIMQQILDRQDFYVTSRTQSKNIQQIKSLLENLGFKVRVENTLPAMLAMLVWFNAQEKLMTSNPNWIIYADIFGSRIYVKYIVG